MRKKKVWRYWCDHCDKGGCSGGHIARHERGCCENPNRICGLCAHVGDVTQQPMDLLIAALRAGGLVELRSLAENCPACMLAAIIQDRRERGHKRGAMHDEEEYDRYGEFKYREERLAWWKQTNERNAEWDY